MANTDYQFYKNTYLGIVIDDSTQYPYFAERAGEQLALYAKDIPNTEEAQNALKRCECRIADILFEDFSSSKYGQKISGESVSGYYSVSYAINDIETVNRLIRNAINLYLGRYIFKVAKVIY